MIGIEEFIRSMPKVELHVELEGAVRPATLLRLADRHGVTLPGDTETSLAKWIRYRSYAHFLEVGLAVNSCIRTAEDVEEVARDFLTAQWEERISYSEVSYTPHTMTLAGDEDFQRQIDGVNRARSWAARELGVGMGLVIQLPRRARSEDALSIVRRAGQRAGDGVVAVCFTGFEEIPDEMGDAVELARESDLAVVLDVQQISDPEVLRRIVESIEPDRLLNPVCAAENENLLARIRRDEVSIVICPTAAVTLGGVSSLQELDLPTLLERGTLVSVSTQSPCLLGVSLTGEYLAAYRSHSEESVRRHGSTARLVRNSVGGTLLPPHDKSELRRRFEARLEELLEDVDTRVSCAGRND